MSDCSEPIEGDSSGHFGDFGGRFVPEALWAPLEEISSAYQAAQQDEAYLASQQRWLSLGLGRPTAISHLRTLSDERGGAQLWVKREDLSSTGSFCATAAFAQAFLARRMKKAALMGETATGDFGVALGSAGAALGMEVTIYMRRDDLEAESINVARMRQLGVELLPVPGPAPGRRQAMAEALRQFSTNWERVFYATSSLASPAPYPQIIGQALSVIGGEACRQLKALQVEAEYVVAPVGSGSFAAGLFQGFLRRTDAQLVGVQAGGDESLVRGADSLVRGRPGVYLGTRSLVLQDDQGQIETAHTESTGMAMPVAGPQHARWLQEGRVHYVTVTDKEALEARQMLVQREGILASLESGYGLAYALKLAETLHPDQHILVGISGSGIADLWREVSEESDGRRT